MTTEKTYMTKSQYAKYRGVTPATVTGYLKRGKIKATPKGKINVKRADDILNQKSNSQPLLKTTAAAPAVKTKATKSNENFWELKEQEKRLKVEEARLNLEIKKGLYVRIADVNKALFVKGQEVRVKVLNAPKRIAPNLLNKKINEMIGIMEAEFGELLDDITDEVKLND